MPAFPKRQGYLGMGKQATKGTGVAPSKFLRWNGATKMSPEMGFTRYREGGDSYYPGITLKENHRPDGQFAALARPDTAAFLLAMWAGKDTFTLGSPNTHVLTPTQDPPWVTLERSLAGQIIERIIDAKIKTVTVEGESGKPIKLTVDYLGTTAAKQLVEATTTLEAEMPWIFFNGVYTLDGAQVAEIISFKMELVNIFDEEDFTTQLTRDDILLIGRDVIVEWVMKMTSGTRYFETYYGGGTTPATALDEGTFIVDLNYGSGAALRQLKIDVPKVYHESAPIELETSDEKQVYECKAHGSKGAGDLVTITIKNNTGAAYV